MASEMRGVEQGAKLVGPLPVFSPFIRFSLTRLLEIFRRLRLVYW